MFPLEMEASLATLGILPGEMFGVVSRTMFYLLTVQANSPMAVCATHFRWILSGNFRHQGIRPILDPLPISEEQGLPLAPGHLDGWCIGHLCSRTQGPRNEGRESKAKSSSQTEGSVNWVLIALFPSFLMAAIAAN